MSRLGKKPITIPEKTEVTISDNHVVIKGPLGQLELDYKPVVEVKNENNEIVITPKNDELETMALWGTYSSLLNSMVQGVNQEFEKGLIVEGVGYKAAVQGDKLVMNVGYSHPIELKIPEGLNVAVEKDQINIKGIDKQSVGQFAAEVRATRKPEPYKGKGVRYSDEVVRRKQGKKTA